MAINRRGLLVKISLLLAIIAIPMTRFFRQTAKARVVRAMPGRVYPGPVRPLDDENIRRPGEWAG